MTDLASLRRDYTLASLDESEVHVDPFEQFSRWFDEARRAEVGEPNAMTLATATAEGVPSARTVLLKSFDPRGFVFFTNHDSQKGAELARNPRASLVFFWQPIERQVLIAGAVARVAREESEAYFLQRPRLSQLGAWASAQSQGVPSRKTLEDRFAEVEGPASPARRSPARPTGAASASRRRGSNSGKVVVAASTTGSATCARGKAGSSSAFAP
jgi:pyridoxamine 5'-phosphate oxidase